MGKRYKVEGPKSIAPRKTFDCCWLLKTIEKKYSSKIKFAFIKKKDAMNIKKYLQIVKIGNLWEKKKINNKGIITAITVFAAIEQAKKIADKPSELRNKK